MASLFLTTTWGHFRKSLLNNCMQLPLFGTKYLTKRSKIIDYD